jgi:hypothetical protein
MEERTVVAHGCRKTKKLKCGMEGKNVEAYGCLPSYTPSALRSKLSTTFSLLNRFNILYVTDFHGWNCRVESKSWQLVLKWGWV